MARNIGIILAGGKGVRFKADIPKQFVKIAGKTVLEHTVEVFCRCDAIDEIAIVVCPEYIETVESFIIKNDWIKVKKVLAGGAERYMSSFAAIEAYRNEPDVNLIFNDAVRPLLTVSVVEKVINALDMYDAVNVAVPATDTIIEIDTETKHIKSIPKRSSLYMGQTPQGFKLSVLDKAYRIAFKDKEFTATDDCGVVKKYLPDVDIYVVDGLTYNLKLTNAEDLFLFEKLFHLNSL